MPQGIALEPVNLIDDVPLAEECAPWHYLKCLPKNDLITLLEIIDDARTAQSLPQFQHCFTKLKHLLLFDGALTVYSDKEALERNEVPRFRHYNLNFSKEFLEQYTEGRVFERSHVFQAVYNTRQPCH